MSNLIKNNGVHLDSVSGIVACLFHCSPTFSAGKLEDGTRFAGRIMMEVGDEVKLWGEWVDDGKWGKQFRAQSFEFSMPLDKNGLAAYLAKSKCFSDIGPVRARIIADAFGNKFQEALDGDLQHMADVIKVPLAVIENLKKEWNDRRAFNLASTWLSIFGLTPHQIKKLIDTYQNNVIAVVKKNPYIIEREVDGYGFKKVDEIAMKMGISKTNPNRIECGLRYCLAQEMDEGHTWTHRKLLTTRCSKLLEIESEHVTSVLNGQEMTIMLVEDENRIAIAHVFKHEELLCKRFKRARDPNPHRKRLIANTAGLTNDQILAIDAFIKNTIITITGGAGTGKTYVIKTICHMCSDAGLLTVLCAPTGKAARRMQESTDHPAMTIHRLLGWNGSVFHAEYPLTADVLVIDECSMVDTALFAKLMEVIDLNQTVVVIVGDHHQLPPIGPGNVLRDIITENRTVPVVVLNQIVRQAGLLKENSVAVLNGQVAKSQPCNGFGPWYRIGRFNSIESLASFVEQLYQSKLHEEFGLNLLHDVQLLTPTRKGVLGVNAINAVLQRIIQKKLYGVNVAPLDLKKRPIFYKGDKVIQRKNDYKLSIMNGEIGKVVQILDDGAEMHVEFDKHVVIMLRSEGHLDRVDLAYALTVHQTQGSEFPVAILIMHNSHAFQHHRNMLYTGVTRASRSVIIVGDDYAIDNCARKVVVDRRRTWLPILFERP